MVHCQVVLGNMKLIKKCKWKWKYLKCTVREGFYEWFEQSTKGCEVGTQYKCVGIASHLEGIATLKIEGVHYVQWLVYRPSVRVVWTKGQWQEMKT